MENMENLENMEATQITYFAQFTDTNGCVVERLNHWITSWQNTASQKLERILELNN